ncbi:MAG: phospho-sugar mutase [Firmicutes bacterium]|nr:phospho-sugar mutase [Bacillota bacterium]
MYDSSNKRQKQQWEISFETWLNSEALDEESKKELLQIKDNKDEIMERFAAELEFGTGGLRGIMAAGTNKMNKYVIRRTTQGLANYINQQYPEIKEKKVAIAYDSRFNSREFAEETARVVAGNGIKALIFREMRPTPQLSFAVRELGCQAGVIITASHNPPQYNGFKVYGEDGGQAATDLAAELSAKIKEVDYFTGINLLSKNEAIERGLWKYIEENFDSIYLEKIKSLSLNQGDKDIRVVYTPLHGTGLFLIPRLLKELGYRNVFIVEEQAALDPAFPTVESPNPEERKSFDLALRLAEAKDADLVLATDPDADRVGCAVKAPGQGYAFLNGNQVGALLLEYLLGRLQEKGGIPDNGVMIKTIVTGNLGKKIAASYGVETVETLTGFKYIGEKMKEYDSTGERRFLFGYEESCGYLAGTFVRDKDAVISSSLLVEMTAYYKKQGKNVLEVLEELYSKHGYHLEVLESIQLENIAQAAEILRSFRDNPMEMIGGLKIEERRDYRQGKFFNMLTGKEGELLLPRSDVLFFALEGGAWFSIRPSGTEPKIKYYFSVNASSQKEAEAKMSALKNDVLARAAAAK